MLKGNTMAKALVNAGLAEMPKEKKFRHKAIKCRKCKQSNMKIEAGENFAVCPECGNYIIFSD